MRTRDPALRTLPSRTSATFSFRATVGMSTLAPLKLNAEVRDATRRPRIFDSTLSSSSDRPSAKYSFAASSLMLTKGSTAIDGVSAPAGGGAAVGAAPAAVACGGEAAGSQRQREAIAAAGNGGDRVRPQDLAQRGHLDLEVVLLDDDRRPHPFDQLALGHQLPGPLDQRHQHVERARAQARRFAVDQQALLRGLQQEAAEAVVGGGRIRGHAGARSGVVAGAR